MKDTDIVVFRKWAKGYGKGDIIALFPCVPAGIGLVSSYMHIGQHGAADYRYVISITVPAKPREYASLLRELLERGYDVLVRERFFQSQCQRKDFGGCVCR